MASDPTETGQAVHHGPHSRVWHARPNPDVSINQIVAGRHRPPAGLPVLYATNEQSVSLWSHLLLGSDASTPHRTEGDALAPKPISVGRREAVAGGTGTVTMVGTGKPLDLPD